MKMLKTSMIAAAISLMSAHAFAQITFYEHDDFRGRTFTTQGSITNFQRTGFNDRASSVMVGRGRWEVCDDSSFRGECVVLRPGNYRSLADMGINDRLSSVRPANKRRSRDLHLPDPMSGSPYEYRLRANEPIYQARVNSVRAVIGASDERCWIEREQVSQRGGKPSVERGIVGALLGGVLGHQIGGGRGRDAATVGGVVAGAVIGANSGRDRYTTTRDVRRCETAGNGEPDYWDIGYIYGGEQHYAQMQYAPGATISVNQRGEPRQ